MPTHKGAINLRVLGATFDGPTNYKIAMNKRDTLEKILMFFAFICIILSYIFIANKNIFKIGFYLFADITLWSIFIRYKKFLSTTWKIIWSLFILAILFVIISIIYFPTWDIKDIATFSILLFAISFNKLYKKNIEKFDKE